MDKIKRLTLLIFSCLTQP